MTERQDCCAQKTLYKRPSHHDTHMTLRTPWPGWAFQNSLCYHLDLMDTCSQDSSRNEMLLQRKDYRRNEGMTPSLLFPPQTRRVLWIWGLWYSPPNSRLYSNTWNKFKESVEISTRFYCARNSCFLTWRLKKHRGKETNTVMKQIN